MSTSHIVFVTSKKKKKEKKDKEKAIPNCTVLNY